MNIRVNGCSLIPLQVVRGVIPAGPQYDYHPNPYLQHLYHRQQQSGASNTPDPNSSVINLDFDDIDAQLNQLVAESNGDATLAGAQHSHGPVEQGTPGVHTHGHTHAPRRNLADSLNWKIFLSSGSFAIILFLRLMVDHILGKVMLRNCTIALFYPRKSNITWPNFRKELKEKDHFTVICL